MKKEKDKKKKRARPPEQAAVLQPAAPIPQENSLQGLYPKLGGKWKMCILWALRSRQSIRYSEIKANIPGITDMMLSQSLKELCADGLAERRQFQEIPPRVEYQMTALGAGALPGLELLAQWLNTLNMGR